MKNILKICLVISLFNFSHLAMAHTIEFGSLVKRFTPTEASAAASLNESFNLHCELRDPISRGNVYVIFNNNPQYIFHLTQYSPSFFEVKNIKAAIMDNGMTGIYFVGMGSQALTTITSTGKPQDYAYLSCTSVNSHS